MRISSRSVTKSAANAVKGTQRCEKVVWTMGTHLPAGLVGSVRDPHSNIFPTVLVTKVPYCYPQQRICGMRSQDTDLGVKCIDKRTLLLGPWSTNASFRHSQKKRESLTQAPWGSMSSAQESLWKRCSRCHSHEHSRSQHINSLTPCRGCTIQLDHHLHIIYNVSWPQLLLR